MQLVGTRARDHRGDRVSGLGAADPCRWASVRRLDPVAAAQAPGAHGGRWRVGPGRGARLSTSPFPRTALRTRRASHPGTGLSTRPVTNSGFALWWGVVACRGDRLAGLRLGREHRRLLPFQGAAADAHLEPTVLACRPAGRVSSLLHHTDLPGIPGHGVRAARAARTAYGHRDAGRGTAGRGVAPRAGAPLLRGCALVGRCPWPASVRSDRGLAGGPGRAHLPGRG